MIITLNEFMTEHYPTAKLSQHTKRGFYDLVRRDGDGGYESSEMAWRELDGKIIVYLDYLTADG